MTVTKKDCREIAPLLAGLAEEGAPAPDAGVARHLAECAGCRRHLQVQRDVHGLLRARSTTLQGRAPETLRTRLASTVARVPWTRRRLVRMPVAATVGLALLAALLYGMTGVSSTVLAAQLTLDHVKCARGAGHGRAIDPARAAREWAVTYGWTPRLPAETRSGRATLIGVRRCLYGHGHLAHLLYDVEGRVVSLFVMPRREYPAGDPPATHAVLGQQAQVWARGDQSFAVVGDVSPERLAALASDFRAAGQD